MPKIFDGRRDRRPGRSLLLPALLSLTVLLLPGPAPGQEGKEKPAPASSPGLQFSGAVQFLYINSEKGIDSFSIPRARLSLTGGLVKNLKFRLQVDGTKSPALVDAVLDYQFKPYLGLRVGQYYVPFSQESTTSDSELDTIYRSQAVLALSPGRDIGHQGRDIGLMLTGRASIVEYYLGVFNGAGINRADTNKDKDVGARVIVRPVKGLTVGGSIYNGNYSAVQGAAPVTRDRAGLEGRLTAGPVSLKTEYISADDGGISRSGWYVQGTYAITPGKLEAVAKWDTYDPDRDLGADRNDALTLGATWSIQARTRLLVNYSLLRKEGLGRTDQFLAVQFQAGF